MEDEHKCRPLLVCLESAGIVSVRARVEVTVLTEHALAPPETELYRARIFKLLWSPEIDSKGTIPPPYVAWRAGTTTLFLLGS